MAKKFDADKLAHCLSDGMKYKEVAEIYGCSVTTVYYATRSTVRQRRQERDEKIIRLRSEVDANGCPKYSHEQIAKMVGCHRQTVGSVLMQQPEYKRNLKAKRHKNGRRKGRSK